MDQESLFSREDARKLLGAMIQHNRPAVIDWVNRSITILSDEKPLMRDGKQIQLSDGPATYRDRLYHFHPKPNRTGSPGNHLATEANNTQTPTKDNP